MSVDPELCGVAICACVVLALAAGALIFSFHGAEREAARWRYGARAVRPVASYEDGNEPGYYLVVALDDVQSDVITCYDVTDTRTGRAFRVKVVPLELAPPQGGTSSVSSEVV